MQAQPRNTMTNCLPSPSETKNMSDGCSAVVIQAGSRRGLANWLPISARDAEVVTSWWRGNWQEKSLAWTRSIAPSIMCNSGKFPSKPFSHTLSRDSVPAILGSSPLKP
eukprot:3978990-Amphidinium_carterae.1